MKCCGYEMLERKDFDGKPIYWCSSCGKKIPRSFSTADHSQLTENLVDSQSDLPPIPKRREGGDCV